jgi:hypothetical protein
MKERPDHSIARPHAPRTGILHWIKSRLSRAYRCESEIEELLPKFVISSAPFTRPIFYRHAQLSTPENVLFEVSTEGSLRISPIDIDRKAKELIFLHVDAGKRVISINLVFIDMSVSPYVRGCDLVHERSLYFFNEMQVKRERLSWQITRGSNPTDELIAGGVIEGADMNCLRDTVMLWRVQRENWILHREKDVFDSPNLIAMPLPRKRSELP